MASRLFLAGARAVTVVTTLSFPLAGQAFERGFPSAPAPHSAQLAALVDPGERLYHGRPRGADALHWAALRDQGNSVATLLERGMPVDVPDQFGRTPLMVAAAFDSADAAEVLLGRGADPSARDGRFGDTPLHFAARAAHVTVAELLLRYGADVNGRSDHRSATPLHYAAVYGHRRMIAFLVDRGAEIDARDIEGITPLQYAGWRARNRTIDLLVSLGARPDNLHEAVNAGDVARVLTHLRDGADVNAPDLFGTPLHRAVGGNKVYIANVLIEHGADLEAQGDPGRAHPLHLAALSGHADAASLLLDRGAEVDSRDMEGRTPLMVAALHGKATVARLLLARGADPRAVDSTLGYSAIHYATFSRRPELAELLLAGGADVNTPSGNSRTTPLHSAAGHDGDGDMVRFLVSRGADRTARDANGLTPFEVATNRGKLSIAAVDVLDLLRPP